jgi:hypothetical protein
LQPLQERGRDTGDRRAFQPLGHPLPGLVINLHQDFLDIATHEAFLVRLAMVKGKHLMLRLDHPENFEQIDLRGVGHQQPAAPDAGLGLDKADRAKKAE